jgi:hypothetical protein
MSFGRFEDLARIALLLVWLHQKKVGFDIKIKKNDFASIKSLQVNKFS